MSKSSKRDRNSEGGESSSGKRRVKESGAAASSSSTAAAPQAEERPPLSPAAAPAVAAPAAATPAPECPVADEDSHPHLCCSVCLSFPEAEVLQCCAGHIVCGGCYERVCHEEKPSCPSCREALDLFKPIRNMLAERSIAMLPIRCPNDECGRMLTRGGLPTHLADECAYRRVACKYSPLGCKWEGVAGELAAHEDRCKKAEAPGWKLLKRVVEREAAQRSAHAAALTAAREGQRVVEMLSSRCKNVEFTNVVLHRCSAHEHVAGRPAHCVSATFHALGFRWKLYTLSEHTERRFSAVLQLRESRAPLRTDAFILPGHVMPEGVQLRIGTLARTFDSRHKTSEPVLLAEGGAAEQLDALESVTLRVGLIDRRAGRPDPGFLGQLNMGGGGLDGWDEEGVLSDSGGGGGGGSDSDFESDDSGGASGGRGYY